MEYDNDDTWRRPSPPKRQRSTCQQIPKRSTSMAVIVLGLAVLSCLLGYCVLSETLPYESKTLRQVIIIVRHGARTPLSSYNSDPYKNYQWHDGLGSLTNVGKMQLYELGKKFRSYYANFIPDEYLEKDVYVQSSDYSRCLMSAYTFLAGLFPPVEDQRWHPEIHWQPIPVHSLPRSLDKVVAASKNCNVWKAMYNEKLAEMNADPKFADLFDYLTKYTNETLRSIVQVDYLYSALLSEREAGLKLPEWTKNVFPTKMRTPFMLSLALAAYNETMQRFKVGPLLGEVQQYQEAARLGAGRRVHVYVAHDVTLVSVWRALGRPEFLLPEYGASLALELHEDQPDSYFVKVFYRNNTKVEVPMEVKLPFCEDACPLARFSDHLATLTPADWEAECANTD